MPKILKWEILLYGVFPFQLNKQVFYFENIRSYFLILFLNTSFGKQKTKMITKYNLSR